MEQDSTGPTTTAGTDGGLHPAGDGESLRDQASVRVGDRSRRSEYNVLIKNRTAQHHYHILIITHPTHSPSFNLPTHSFIYPPTHPPNRKLTTSLVAVVVQAAVGHAVAPLVVMDTVAWQLDTDPPQSVTAAVVSALALKLRASYTCTGTINSGIM